MSGVGSTPSGPEQQLAEETPNRSGGDEGLSASGSQPVGVAVPEAQEALTRLRMIAGGLATKKGIRTADARALLAVVATLQQERDEAVERLERLSEELRTVNKMRGEWRS